MKQGQAHQDATRSTLADGGNSTASRGPPTVLFILSNHSELQSIVNVGNKKVKSYVNLNICPKITQKKRKQLINIMKQLRDAEFFAYIPFSPDSNSKTGIQAR